ncbi:TetR/AcrR family transcriptional regulator [Mycolicibacterium sediminis]|uniref:TetR family transcriptional regulator n=1 Tax=Mycolicibacterium sediminis TaxID=1286180 RepID=A0A7I7QSF2_9MYCO|nr:TetR/AcrR family transcriptional regulator [Mycolicibacterium sediminis]BBY28766.1 TetR family transcriptional regulator [Mycolicibacterium sediminis]
MKSAPQALSHAQARTRSAIIEATVSVLAANRTASLPVIAEAAGVGRTTVHRYFPDRDHLIREVAVDSIAVVRQLGVRADTTHGTAVDALHRLLAAYFSESDRIVFLFKDPAVLQNVPPDEQPDDDFVMDLIRRGQVEGNLTSDLSAVWIQHALLALVLQGCEDVSTGELPAHTAVTTILRTFLRGASA